MLSTSAWFRAALSASAFLVLGARDAAADPILDPMTCEIVTGTSATCPADPNFTSPAAGVFMLWVQNGDDGANPRGSMNATTNVASIISLDHAGARLLDPHAQAN